MSDEYDIIVYPEMFNGRGVSLKGSVSMKYLRQIAIPVPGNRQIQSFTFEYQITEKTLNSKLFAVVRKGGDAVVTGGPLPSYRVNHISGVRISGDKVFVDMLSNSWDGPYFDNSGVVDVYEILDDTAIANDSYGLKIIDGVDWTRFASLSDVCVLFMKQRITVTSSGWVLPSDIPNRDTCFIFADWNHDSIAVQYDAQTKMVSSIGGAVDVDVFIFTVPLQLTPPDYGIAMYNDQGTLTFSSENVPICYPNSTVKPTEVTTTLPFSSAMILLSNYGFKVDTSSSRVAIYSVAMIKYNNSVRLVRGALAYYFAIRIGSVDYPYANFETASIDKSIYAD